MKKPSNPHGHIFAGDMYCTNHQGKAKREGGLWLVTENGRSRRWLCAMCAERRAEKMKAAA